MVDVVLARKYRPRRFDEMVGQDHVVRALTNALASGRLHHAYLFTGTRGIGKTTVSRILAKSLNCTGADGQGGVTATPCGRCQACIEIDADRFIDYIELDAASNRGIDEARDLIERAAYKPSVGRYKVFMIDEAHQLTKDAFSALLKTLEEPPEYLKFVLATTDPEKMLPTVLSRCLQFNLRPMAPETVQEHLQRVLAAEQVAFDAMSLKLLARAARGSMRDALSLTDQAIAFGGGKLDEAGVRSMLGSVDGRHAAALVRALAARDGAAVLATVDTLRQQGLSAAGALESLALLLQQMAVAQAVPSALEAADPEAAETIALAALLPPDETQLLYSIALHGRAELPLMSDEYAALTMVLLRLLAFAPAGGATAVRAEPPVGAVSAAAAVKATAPAQASVSMPASASAPTPVSAPTAPTAMRAQPRRRDAEEAAPWVDAVPPEGEVRAGPAASTPTPAPASFVATELGQRWAEQVAQMQRDGLVTALVRELAMQAQCLACERGDGATRWLLRVEREALRTPALREKLQAALAAADGGAHAIDFDAGVAEDSPALREAAAKAQALQAAEAVIRADPAVRELMAQFKTARIVPGSIKPTGRNPTP
ncbi:MAG: DNA polymerase III subunit gamma/tau [Burkholderiaceae bacterium]